MLKKIAGLLLVLLLFSAANSQSVTIMDLAEGWAGNAVNTVVFRKNSIASYKNHQFAGFYDAEGFVVLGKRKLNGRSWQLVRTRFKGNIRDAHNSISLIVDGDGYLHLAWDHHNSRLRYCRSVAPLSLELTEEMPMTGAQEERLSYPEFYYLPEGDLLFFYRDGGSGNGNLVINRYSLRKKGWTRIQSDLIDGEGQRNAYWQACVDRKGVIYLSWVWRESPDVASNHDLCFALSKDGGRSWQRSDGTPYKLPVTAGNAEYALRIPQKSELINQTSMCTDEEGNVFIAGYWRPSGTDIPQYHLLRLSGGEWKLTRLDFRKTAFTLSGAGSKKIPISRPQVIASKKGKKLNVWIIFRDEERGNKASLVAITDWLKPQYRLVDLPTGDLGSWEPSFDLYRWSTKRKLDLFVQRTLQADGEGLTDTPPQMVRVLEWTP